MSTFRHLDPDATASLLAERVRAERLRLDWKQSTLAERSGVSLPTVRRYERTGRITVDNLLRLCHALGRLDEFARLLEPPAAGSMEELRRRAAAADVAAGAPKRVRGTR